MLSVRQTKAISSIIYYSTQTEKSSPRHLYKYLLRQFNKLPDNGPRKFYKNAVKQSFIQHLNENDSERIEQIIKRAYEDADWILNKYLKKSAQ
ncbi:hypothetical protein RN001_011623 [Aquatica leii]|uniref:LYR motif-containing protein 9 n=1 Tax=Aquatica leii TaxID=1421715 RepID=A0AAN7P4J6_9COLE|nr:hypothetical protein RN001_011623 [Aquatica leii]